MESIDVDIAELQAPETLVFRREQLPFAPGPGEVAARTLATAISPGTELAAYGGSRPLRPGDPYPRLVGYCNVAEIERVGEGVEGLRPGDRIYTHQSHRSAFVCPAADVLATVPESVETIPATTTYLFHLGFDAVQRGGCRIGTAVAVVGLGTLGLTTVAMARVAGARVTAVTGQHGRTDLARTLGADAVLPKDAAEEELDAVQADVVVTTSSSWRDWPVALRLARRYGTVVVVGFPGRDEVAPDFNPLDAGLFYGRQLTLVASGLTGDLAGAVTDPRFTLGRNCECILELIGKGAVQASAIVTAVRPWAELDDAYRTLARREPDEVTIVLDWR